MGRLRVSLARYGFGAIGSTHGPSRTGKKSPFYRNAATWWRLWRCWSAANGTK